MSNGMITSKGLSYLAESISNSKTIKKISFSNN